MARLCSGNRSAEPQAARRLLRVWVVPPRRHFDCCTHCLAASHDWQCLNAQLPAAG